MVRISCVWQAAFAINRIDLVMTLWLRLGFMCGLSRLIIAISLALTISSTIVAIPMAQRILETFNKGLTESAEFVCVNLL